MEGCEGAVEVEVEARMEASEDWASPGRWDPNAIGAKFEVDYEVR